MIASNVFGLNPDTERYDATPAVPFGAYATPELTVADPRVMVAFAVIVNAADATLPRLSVTAIIWLPATKSAVSGDLVTLNWNADVPCSVTIGVAGINGEIVVGATPFPILMLVKLAPGPNPVTVAVISVPTGPEAGDRVTVGVLSVKVVSALLP